MNTITSKLNMTSRISRILIGSGMIGIIMAANGPLGYLTLLPLLAIYPLMTGLLGEDPIDGLLSSWVGGFDGHCFRPSTRIALVTVGIGAIGAFMVNPQSVVSLAGIVTLFSVFPVMAGLFGEDLFSTMFSGKGRVDSYQLEATQMGGQYSQGMVHHHDFGKHHGSHDKAA